MNTKDGFMHLLHKRGTGGIKNSQKNKICIFDCFYVMPPLKKGVHYTSLTIFFGMGRYSDENRIDTESEYSA